MEVQRNREQELADKDAEIKRLNEILQNSKSNWRRGFLILGPDLDEQVKQLEQQYAKNFKEIEQ